MSKNKLLLQSLINSIGTVIYVASVAWLMSNAQSIFGHKPGIVSGLAFLMLFILSALICGSLVLGRPIYLYWEGQKKESVSLFILTTLWLILFTCLSLIILTLS